MSETHVLTVYCSGTCVTKDESEDPVACHSDLTVHKETENLSLTKKEEGEKPSGKTIKESLERTSLTTKNNTLLRAKLAYGTPCKAHTKGKLPEETHDTHVACTTADITTDRHNASGTAYDTHKLTFGRPKDHTLIFKLNTH